ncbi:hypothetical protein EMCRGX_G015522 [Ephydatia muelleri]|eukprot:Em0005g513a
MPFDQTPQRAHSYRTLFRSTVLRVVSKFVEHGTVQDRLKTNCGRKKTVQVPRNVGIIAQKMWQTPTLSIRRLHLGTGLRRSSVQKMLRKTLKMKAYRRLLVQALLPGDIDKGFKWAEDYLEAAERDFTYPDYILWTDEAIFHLDGHVNRHNDVIWASAPSATTAEGVASPGWTSAHYETRVRAWLDGKLEDRWMGRGGPMPWPALSPGLSPLDFWLWSYLKNKVYANAVTTLDELRQAITDEIQAIPATMVHSATLVVVRKAGLLLSIDGLQYGKSKKRSRAELESLAKRVRFEEPKTEVQLLTERSKRMRPYGTQMCILEKKILDL